MWDTLKIFLGHLPVPFLVQENHNSHTFPIPLCSANKHISSSKQLHPSLHINLCTWGKYSPEMRLSGKLCGAKFYHEVSLFLRSRRGRMGSEHRRDELSSCRHFTLSEQMSIFPLTPWNCVRHFTKQTCFFFFFLSLAGIQAKFNMTQSKSKDRQE